MQDELQRLNSELRKLHIELEHSNWRASYEAANAAGRMAINALLLASGGAVVALLAFLGNLLSKDISRDYIAQMHIALITHNAGNVLKHFASSLIFAVTAAALTYLAMFFYSGSARIYSENAKKAGCYDKIGTAFNYVAITSGIFSLAFLIYGAHVGVSMLQTI